MVWMTWKGEDRFQDAKTTYNDLKFIVQDYPMLVQNSQTGFGGGEFREKDEQSKEHTSSFCGGGGGITALILRL